MALYVADYGANITASPACEWDGRCTGNISPFLIPPPGFMIPVTQDVSPVLSPRGDNSILMEAGTDRSAQVPSHGGNCFPTNSLPESRLPQLSLRGSAGGSDIPGIDSQIYHAWGEDGASILQHLEASGCELHQRIVSFSLKQWSLRKPVNTISTPDLLDPGISNDAYERILDYEVHYPDSLSCPSPRTKSSAFHDDLHADFERPVEVEAQIRDSPSCCLSEDTTYWEEYCERLSPCALTTQQSADLHIEERQSSMVIAPSSEEDCVTTGRKKEGLRRTSTDNLEQAIKDFNAEASKFEQAVKFFVAQVRCCWPQDTKVLEPAANCKTQRVKTRHKFSRDETVCLARAVKKVLSFWCGDQGPSLAFWEAVYEATNLPQPISPGKLQTKWRYELGKYCKWQHSTSAKSGGKSFKEWRSEYLSFCNHLLCKR